jgi:hypothetical protein
MALIVRFGHLASFRTYALNGRYWHLTDKRTRPWNGRYWSNSGHWPAMAPNGSVANDP